MNSITGRYAAAVHTSNLASSPRTTCSPSDVLGAFGIAGRRHPLAVALARLFVGDNHAAGAIVAILSGMALSRAKREGVKLRPVECDDMARAVLAWHRDGLCRPCGGHGVLRVPGTTTLSDSTCPKCRGTRKVPFDAQFSVEHLIVARWLQGEIEREAGKAGPAAMAALAPRLEL